MVEVKISLFQECLSEVSGHDKQRVGTVHKRVGWRIKKGGVPRWGRCDLSCVPYKGGIPNP